MNTATLKKTWDRFKVKDVDPWTRRNGVRLMVSTSPQYAVREDGEGRLVPIGNVECLVGRDEAKARRLIRQEAKRCTEELMKAVQVPREAVVGKEKTLRTERARKMDISLVPDLATGKLAKPSGLYATYRTPAGKTKIVRVLEDSN